MPSMKEVIIKMKMTPHTWVRQIMSKGPVHVRILDCRPLQECGVLELFEIRTEGNLDEIIETLKRYKEIFDFEILSKDYKRGEIVGTLKTTHCDVCKHFTHLPECFLGSADYQLKDGHVHWRLLLTNEDLKLLLKKFDEMGIDVEIEQISSYDHHQDSLTLKQEQIVKLAWDMGYFETPRKISLKKLSQILGVSPPTLSEILRRGLRKIVREYFERTRLKE